MIILEDGNDNALIWSKTFVFEYTKISHREGGTDYGNKHIWKKNHYQQSRIIKTSGKSHIRSDTEKANLRASFFQWRQRTGGSIIKAVPIALSSLIKMTGEDNELLNQILSSFSCERDEDIETFLHSRAVEFEEIQRSSDGNHIMVQMIRKISV